MASKNGFLICNACSHSHSPTLHLFKSLSSVFPFLFFSRSLFPFSFSVQRGIRKTEGHCSLLKALFFQVDSLRYLQERLALQHLLPAMPSRSRDHARMRDSIERIPDIADLGYRLESVNSPPRDNHVSACIWHSSLHELTRFRLHSCAFCLPYCLVRTGYGIVVAPSPL